MSDHAEHSAELSPSEKQKIKLKVQKLVQIKLGYLVDSKYHDDRNAEANLWTTEMLSEKFREIFDQQEIVRGIDLEVLASNVHQAMLNSGVRSLLE